MNTLVADARARFDAFAGEAAAAVDAARSPERDRDEVREQLEEMLERDNWVATQRMMQPHHGGDRGGWGTTAAAVPPHPAMFSRRAFRKYMDDDHSDASSETESGYDDSSSESERDRRGSRGRRRQGRHRRRHSSTSEEEEETDPEQGHQQDGRGGEAQTKSATGATAAGTSDTEDGVQAGAGTIVQCIARLHLGAFLILPGALHSRRDCRGTEKSHGTRGAKGKTSLYVVHAERGVTC